MLQIPKPFPDELAHAHRLRILARNQMSFGENIWQLRFFSVFLKAAESQKPEHCPFPWRVRYVHEIIALLSEMDLFTYRAQHTMLALTSHWPFLKKNTLDCNREIWQMYAFPGLYSIKA